MTDVAVTPSPGFVSIAVASPLGPNGADEDPRRADVSRLLGLGEHEVGDVRPADPCARP
jgi:hypothetical protein